MSLTVRRPAGPAEVEAARLLTDESWLDVYPRLIGEDVTHEIIETRHSAERFARNAAETDGIFLVALSAGEVVGHLYARPDDGTYVDRLHIAPARRGEGIGAALLAYLRALLPAGERLWLTVLDGNEGAARFYRREGFTLGETVEGLADVTATVCSMQIGENGDGDAG